MALFEVGVADMITGFQGTDGLFLAPLLPEKPPTMSASVGSRLVRVYREDIESLEHLLGRDLTTWKMDAG